MSCEISIHDMIVHIVHLCSPGCLILFNVVYVSEIVRRYVTPYHIGLLTHGFEAIETVCIFPWLSMAFHGGRLSENHQAAIPSDRVPNCEGATRRPVIFLGHEFHYVLAL